MKFVGGAVHLLRHHDQGGSLFPKNDQTVYHNFKGLPIQKKIQYDRAKWQKVYKLCFFMAIFNQENLYG